MASRQFRAEIQRLFAPAILVSETSEVEAICLKNHLSLAEVRTKKNRSDLVTGEMSFRSCSVLFVPSEMQTVRFFFVPTIPLPISDRVAFSGTAHFPNHVLQAKRPFCAMSVIPRSGRSPRAALGELFF